MAALAAYRHFDEEPVPGLRGTAMNDLAARPGRDAAEARQLAVDLAAVAVGDQAAFGRLYDATLGRVYAIVRRICRNPALAEEVTGDVYVQAWREAARFDADRGGVLAWLTVMARSRALDALRRADPSVLTDDPQAVAEAQGLTASSPDSLELLDALRRDGHVRVALAALPARERQMIALAFLRGLTHTEIALEMRLPLGSVKTTIRRALGALRELLAPYADACKLEGNR